MDDRVASLQTTYPAIFEKQKLDLSNIDDDWAIIEVREVRDELSAEDQAPSERDFWTTLIVGTIGQAVRT